MVFYVSDSSIAPSVAEELNQMTLCMIHTSLLMVVHLTYLLLL
jgi:hypothetical protein